MKRSMLGAYVVGSDRAVALYQKAFDAKLGDVYPNPDGTYYHAELDVYGQILAVAEVGVMPYDGGGARVTGNTMQFCLHFEASEEPLVRRAYEVLTEGAEVRFPLGPCDYSPLMFDLVDRFGVRWCLFISSEE